MLHQRVLFRDITQVAGIIEIHSPEDAAGLEPAGK
jgi:hypothetical protein